MQKVLLHICCGVCAFAVIERLKKKGYNVEGLFFNPNIQPYVEYLKRQKAARIVSEAMGIKIENGKYDIFDWFNVCKDYGHEKEGQRRCLLCYELRLKEVSAVSLREGFDYFTTTLTISPHKISKAIIEIGRKIGGKRFLDFDFKKEDGFLRSVEGVKSLNFYRQDYCGCIYSLAVK